MTYQRNLKQAATYFPPGVNDGFGGVTFPHDSINIKVRWEDKAVLFRNEQGEEVVSEAVVYVDRPVAMKGYLVLGSFAPAKTPVAGAKEIRQTHGSPNLSGTLTLRKAYL